MAHALTHYEIIYIGERGKTTESEREKEGWGGPNQMQWVITIIIIVCIVESLTYSINHVKDGYICLSHTI